MIKAYFIGGSKDLSCQFLDNEFEYTKSFKPIDFNRASIEEVKQTSIELEEEIYIRIGEIKLIPGQNHKVVVYALTD